MNSQPPHIQGTHGQTVGQLSVTSPDLDFVLQERRPEDFERAIKHSSNVRWLKILLPALAALIILAVFLALMFNWVFGEKIEIDQISVSDGKLVMENPKLNGFDNQQRPYNLTATRAIQDANNPTRVELQEISAELPFEDTLSASLTAGNGVYDAEAKTLRLDQQVNVVTNNGMAIVLQDADVDISAGSLVTENPIYATSPEAEISSQSLTVKDGGKRLIFDGKVRMILRPDAAKKEEN